MSDLIELHLAHLRAAGRAKRTISGRAVLLARLSARLHPIRIEEACTAELDAFMDTPGWAQWTRCNYAAHLRGFYRWLASGQNPCISFDPTLDMARPWIPDCTPDPVSDEELMIALRLSPDLWRTAIILAAYAGLRATEIGNLDREDVTEARVMIRRAKGGSPASVPTHPVLWEHVRHRPPGPVVVNSLGGRVPGTRLSSIQSAHFRSIGLPGVHLHRFRHWYGTTLLNATDNLRVTQECLRHRSVASTQIYTKVAGEQRRLAVHSLPTLTGPLKDAA